MENGVVRAPTLNDCSAQAPVYPTCDDTYRVWIARVCAAMLREVEHLPRENRFRVTAARRARAMRASATHARGIVCEDCGAPAPATGEIIAGGDDSTGPCHARACPRCARRRSAEVKEWARRLHAIPVPAGWEWALWTVTSQYEPWNPAHLTVAALRSRWEMYRRAWRAGWAWLRAEVGRADRRKLAAVAAVELAGIGNVHLHVLMLAPKQGDKGAALAAAMRDAEPAVGMTDLEPADAGAIEEICKYPIKAPGGAAEDWLGGARALDTETGEALLIHPTLAARWELAMVHRRVHDRYGAARSAPEVPVYGPALPEEHPCRLPEVCSCGARGGWVQTVCDLSMWIRACHARGFVALRSPSASRLGGDLEQWRTARSERNERRNREERRHDRDRWRARDGGAVET